MTAPFNPHLHPVQWTVVLGLPVVALALPFARREDWIGWTACVVLAGYAIFLWGALVVGMSLRLIEWYRGADDE